MAPALVGPEKAARGKTPTDVWWKHDREPDRPGEDRVPDAEAAQRSWSASSRCTPIPGDLVVDFFAGSGTTGEAAARLDAATS